MCRPNDRSMFRQHVSNVLPERNADLTVVCLYNHVNLFRSGWSIVFPVWIELKTRVCKMCNNVSNRGLTSVERYVAVFRRTLDTL